MNNSAGKLKRVRQLRSLLKRQARVQHAMKQAQITGLKHRIVASSSRCATPRSQYSGSTVKGPKNPNDPQRVAMFDPIRRPPSRAAIAFTWLERQRGVMKL